MARTPVQVQPPLEFIPPALTPWVVHAGARILPFWLKRFSAIADIEVQHSERLVELYRDFQTGKTRFLMAFRHPSTLDPLVLYYLLSHEVPQTAQKMGVALATRPHTYFLYDRGLPLWMGPLVTWLFPRMGGISLQRGKLDRQSLRTTREIFANGDQPLLVAPEGATNGLNEIVSPLEPGIAQMGFWCMEDLQEKGRNERVAILPIGLRYHYLQPPWEALEQVLGQLETECGLPQDGALDRYARLIRIGERLLGLLEQYYARFYQQSLPEEKEFPVRLQNLMEAALRVAEQFFNLQPKGGLSDRCRRIEQAGWDRIYREDLKGQTLSPVERGMADRIAEEADLRMWHMRLVESFVSVTGTYVFEKPTAERFAEMVSIVYQTLQRLQGKTQFDPLTPGKLRARITIGTPLWVDERWETYRSGRQAARQAVADLTAELQHCLEAMITQEEN
ncbi:MAG TPA: 1-acyl-sn-glycerol-3-phosphate acyltransferase [Chthonomonadaceae bacterium]|nr:1-acyl-sn-glycerol-3-phosphate acyltransferase [Chthonomonadaceae bacterium]